MNMKHTKIIVLLLLFSFQHAEREGVCHHLISFTNYTGSTALRRMDQYF